MLKLLKGGNTMTKNKKQKKKKAKPKPKLKDHATAHLYPKDLSRLHRYMKHNNCKSTKEGIKEILDSIGQK